jgi:hypothetical protein
MRSAVQWQAGAMGPAPHARPSAVEGRVNPLFCDSYEELEQPMELEVRTRGVSAHAGIPAELLTCRPHHAGIHVMRA